MELASLSTQTLAGLLEQATGQQMLGDRPWRIDSALAPLMRERGLASVAAVAAAAVQEPAGEIAVAAVEALLNHETSFFRDPQALRGFVTDGLDGLRARRGDSRRLRLWSAGCSTGQEAYSLAMAIADAPARWADWDVALIASDVSAPAIAKARDGLFSHFEAQRGLPITSLVRHFELEGESWRIRPELRRMIRFRQHNLLDDGMGERFDAILCRNVLLYFAPDRQRQVLARLREALAPDGLLMLGAGETLLDCDMFSADSELKGLYRASAL